MLLFPANDDLLPPPDDLFGTAVGGLPLLDDLLIVLIEVLLLLLLFSNDDIVLPIKSAFADCRLDIFCKSPMAVSPLLLMLPGAVLFRLLAADIGRACFCEAVVMEAAEVEATVVVVACAAGREVEVLFLLAKI